MFRCVPQISYLFRGLQAEVTDERALTIATKLAGGMAVQAPLGFSAHWFRYRLPLDLLRQGVNVLEVTQIEACRTATFERSINGAQPSTAPQSRA